MNPFLLQILASFLFALALVKDKLTLKTFKLDPPQYTTMVFIWLVIFSAVAASFTHRVNWSLLAEARFYLGFLALVGLAFLWNKLFYYFEEHERLQDFEVMNLVVPAVTAVLGGLLFPEERSAVAFIALMVSLSALAIVRLERHHLQYNAYSGLVLVMIFAMGAETVLRKYLLAVFDPATLYFTRVTLVLLLLSAFYRPRRLPKTIQPWLSAASSSLFGTAAMIMIFYGYRDLGVVLTTLIFLLSPLMVYYLDSLVLRERIKPQNIYASLVIVVAVVVAIYYS